MLALRSALDTIDRSDKLPEKPALEARVRHYLGITFEAMGKERLAYEEYVKVIQDLDPENKSCRNGARRLKKKILARTGAAGGERT